MSQQRYLLEAADRIMIQDLLGRYAFAADYAHGDPHAWSSLFTEDGSFEVPSIGLVVGGRAELERFVDGLHKTVPGIHHVMSNFVIDIDIDGDTARGKCELNEFMLRPEAIYNNLHGWYEDDYVKHDQRWYISVRRVHLTRESSSVATNGKIGEYFADFFAMCEQFRNTAA